MRWVRSWPRNTSRPSTSCACRCRPGTHRGGVWAGVAKTTRQRVRARNGSAPPSAGTRPATCSTPSASCWWNARMRWASRCDRSWATSRRGDGCSRRPGATARRGARGPARGRPAALRPGRHALHRLFRRPGRAAARALPGTMHLVRWTAIREASRRACHGHRAGRRGPAGHREPPGPDDPNHGLYMHKASFGARMGGAHAGSTPVLRPGAMRIAGGAGPSSMPARGPARAAGWPVTDGGSDHTRIDDRGRDSSRTRGGTLADLVGGSSRATCCDRCSRVACLWPASRSWASPTIPVGSGPGSVFVAIQGDHHDGHDHVPAAVAAGAVGLVLERALPIAGRAPGPGRAHLAARWPSARPGSKATPATAWASWASRAPTARRPRPTSSARCSRRPGCRPACWAPSMSWSAARAWATRGAPRPRRRPSSRACSARWSMRAIAGRSSRRPRHGLAQERVGEVA